EVGTLHGGRQSIDDRMPAAARAPPPRHVPDWRMALIQYITQVQLDFGALALLPQELERAGIAWPLIVTDAGVRAAGLLDRALATLGSRPHAVFDATPSNPTERAVRAAVEVYRSARC